MYNFEKLGRKSVIRGVEKYHWIILLKKTNVHTKTQNEIIRSASQHPTHRGQHSLLYVCTMHGILLFSIYYFSNSHKARNLKFPRNDTLIWQCQSVLTIICGIFICCYVWSEYHVLFCIVFCSMLFCKVTIVTCFHQTTKCQPSEPLSIDIMPYIMNKIFTGEAFCGNPSAPASEAGGDRSSRRGLLDFPRILGSFWSLDYFDIHHTSYRTILSAMGSTRNGK